MKYNEFKNSVQNMPLIFNRDILLHKKNKQIIRNQINRWRKKKFLIKLKRGVFILNSNDRKINPSRLYIANQLYSPSYVSLEYALSYYGFIPERVNDITGITTKKTLSIKNELGNFIYQHINPNTFRGFKASKDEAGLSFFIAEPEKAVVDFCYLNMTEFRGDYRDVLEKSYRFQNIGSLNPAKLMKFARLFRSGKLMRISEAICEFIKEEKGK